MRPLVKAALDEAAKPRTMRLGGQVGDACLDLDPNALVLAPVGGAGEQVTLTDSRSPWPSQCPTPSSERASRRSLSGAPSGRATAR
jgi:hypothetical protein